MSSNTTFTSTLVRHQKMVEGLFMLEPQVFSLVKLVQASLNAGNKVLFFGNGGSASDSQHLATEFVVRYDKNRPAYAAIALTTDTSILTAHGNDFGFDTVFNRQIEALARAGDIAIGISTSGNSANVVNGLKAAKASGCIAVGFTGAAGGAVADVADHCIKIPSDETARIQEGHLIVGHFLCEALDTQQ